MELYFKFFHYQARHDNFKSLFDERFYEDVNEMGRSSKNLGSLINDVKALTKLTSILAASSLPNLPFKSSYAFVERKQTN